MRPLGTEFQSNSNLKLELIFTPHPLSAACTWDPCCGFEGYAPSAAQRLRCLRLRDLRRRLRGAIRAWAAPGPPCSAALALGCAEPS